MRCWWRAWADYWWTGPRATSSWRRPSQLLLDSAWAPCFGACAGWQLSGVWLFRSPTWAVGCFQHVSPWPLFVQRKMEAQRRVFLDSDLFLEHLGSILREPPLLAMLKGEVYSPRTAGGTLGRTRVSRASGLAHELSGWFGLQAAACWFLSHVFFFFLRFVSRGSVPCFSCSLRVSVPFLFLGPAPSLQRIWCRGQS